MLTFVSDCFLSYSSDFNFVSQSSYHAYMVLLALVCILHYEVFYMMQVRSQAISIEFDPVIICSRDVGEHMAFWDILSHFCIYILT